MYVAAVGDSLKFQNVDVSGDSVAAMVGAQNVKWNAPYDGTMTIIAPPPPPPPPSNAPYTLWEGAAQVGTIAGYPDQATAEAAGQSIANAGSVTVTVKDDTSAVVATLNPIVPGDWSMVFDGSTTYASLTPFNVGAGPLKIYVWPLPAALVNGTIFRAAGGGKLLDLTVAGGTIYAGFLNGADARLEVPASALTANSWNLVELDWPATGTVLKVNGVQAGPAGTVAPPVWDTSTADTFLLGSDDGTAYFFAGMMSQLTLPGCDLQLDDGPGSTRLADSTGNGHTGTPHGDVSWSDNVPGA